MIYSPLWAALGLALIVVSMYDFYVTTVTVSGSGPLSARLSRSLWQGCLWVHRKRPLPKLLEAAGPIMLLILIVFWFGMAWLGWFLVFCGSEDAVVSASTRMNATAFERLHYAGYTITTIGYGNFMAALPGWQIASVIAGVNGLFLVTLAISYTIPVISAAVEKRQLALQINALGGCTTDILDFTRGNGDYDILVAQLSQFNSSLAALSEKHLAYPILHYFHDEDADVSLPLNLARLEEAIAIILIAFPDLPIQITSRLRMSRRLTARFLEVVSNSFSGKMDKVPSPPDLSGCVAIRNAKFPPEQITNQLEANPQRKKLLAYVLDDGWLWDNVHSDK